MNVKIKYLTSLKELTGIEEETFNLNEGATLADLVFKIASKYGKIGFDTLYEKKTEIIDLSLQFLVNGINGRDLYGPQMELKEGDTVTIIYPIIGG